MEGCFNDELRLELTQLLRKQRKFLESRTFVSASDAEVVEYELRQDVIHDLCQQLANSVEA